MEDSILATIKKKIGGYAEDDTFDEELITNINTALSILSHDTRGDSLWRF